jgi:hypothetical protein
LGISVFSSRATTITRGLAVAITRRSIPAPSLQVSMQCHQLPSRIQIMKTDRHSVLRQERTFTVGFIECRATWSELQKAIHSAGLLQVNTHVFGRGGLRERITASVPAITDRFSLHLLRLTLSGFLPRRTGPHAESPPAEIGWENCKLSSVSSASSRRRRPQPSRMARIARLRFPVRLCPSGTCQSAAASPAVSQLPKRDPSLRTPLTRWMPAANSGLNSPESAAS